MSYPNDVPEPPAAPTEPPDDAVVGWAIVRTEEHLKSIRTMLSWILFIILILVVCGIIGAIQLAEEQGTNF